MSREPYEIITPIEKHKVVLNNYLIADEKKAMTGLPTDLLQDKMMELAIVSADGETDKEKILKNIGQWHGKDYDFLFLEIAKIGEASTLKKKE